MRRVATALAVLAMPMLVMAGCQTPMKLVSAESVAQATTTPLSEGVNGRLAFQLEAPAGDHTQNDIYTVRPNGSGLTALTNTPDQNEFAPAWDAVGQRITFWRAPAPFGPGSIWTMDADGNSQRQLTSGIDARDPVWNPAGTRIAFTMVDASGFHIWTMRASDGADRRQITSGPDLEFEPAWSPDGTRLAFTRGLEQGDPGNVCVINLTTGTVTCLTTSPDYDHQVAWSPDGKRIVFERDFGSSSSIFTVNADGSHETRLTSGTFFDIGPCFSPDGRFIAFGSDRAGTFLDDLWTMRTDGHQLRQILEYPFSEAFPDWQPSRR